MDLTLIGTVATFIASFSLLMALIFGPSLAPPQRSEVIHAAGLPRHRYQRLVATERPVWERLLAPLAGPIAGRLPSLARQVDERLIVRAGLDPEVLSPAEVYAVKLVAAAGVLIVALALTPLFAGALLLGLLPAFGAYVFPTEYLGWRARRRQALKLLRELPDFLAVCPAAGAAHDPRARTGRDGHGAARCQRRAQPAGQPSTPRSRRLRHRHRPVRGAG